jgi:hypothetical protein
MTFATSDCIEGTVRKTVVRLGAVSQKGLKRSRRSRIVVAASRNLKILAQKLAGLRKPHLFNIDTVASVAVNLKENWSRDSYCNTTF